MGVKHPFSAPITCKAYPIAILVHGHCAICASPPTPLLYAIHNIILMMAISCKGQGGGGRVRRRGEIPVERRGRCQGGGVPVVMGEGRFTGERCWWGVEGVECRAYVGNPRSEEKNPNLDSCWPSL